MAERTSFIGTVPFVQGVREGVMGRGDDRDYAKLWTLATLLDDLLPRVKDKLPANIAAGFQQELDNLKFNLSGVHVTGADFTNTVREAAETPLEVLPREFSSVPVDIVVEGAPTFDQGEVIRQDAADIAVNEDQLVTKISKALTEQAAGHDKTGFHELIGMGSGSSNLIAQVASFASIKAVNIAVGLIEIALNPSGSAVREAGLLTGFKGDLAKLAPQLDSFPDRMANEALASMISTNSPDVVSRSLFWVTNKNLSPASRVWVIRAFIRAGSTEVRPTLEGIVKDKTAPDVVRAEAARALGMFADSSSADALLEALKDTRREMAEVRDEAAAALANIALATTIDRAPIETALRVLLKDGEGVVRASAIESLSALNSSQPLTATPPLKDILATGLKDKELVVKIEATRQVRSLSGAEAAPLLRDAFKDPAWQVEAMAASSARGLATDPDVNKVLQEQIDPKNPNRPKDPEVLGRLGVVLEENALVALGGTQSVVELAGIRMFGNTVFIPNSSSYLISRTRKNTDLFDVVVAELVKVLNTLKGRGIKFNFIFSSTGADELGTLKKTLPASFAPAPVPATDGNISKALSGAGQRKVAIEQLKLNNNRSNIMNAIEAAMKQKDVQSIVVITPSNPSDGRAITAEEFRRRIRQLNRDKNIRIVLIVTDSAADVVEQAVNATPDAFSEMVTKAEDLFERK